MTAFGHGGNLKHLIKVSGRSREDICDFSANINPLGPPEWMFSLIESRFHDIEHYPDPDCSSLIEAVSERYNVKPEEVIVGNGSTEILYLLPRILSSCSALIPVPSYLDYTRSVKLAGLTVKTIPLKEERAFTPDIDNIVPFLATHKLVFLGQPNNPTGMLYETSALRTLALQHPTVTFIVDEAFADFVENFESITDHRPPNVVVLLSLTKIFAIPGLRLGCAVANAELIERLREIQPPWSVNSIAQIVGEAALRDHNYRERSRKYTQEGRRQLIHGLRNLGCFTIYHGAANFLLFRIDRNDIDASFIASKLLDEGLAVRLCDNFEGLDGRFLRIAVRKESENTRLLKALKKIV
jgi:adenosylcobyric acid synthase